MTQNKPLIPLIRRTRASQALYQFQTSLQTEKEEEEEIWSKDARSSQLEASFHSTSSLPSAEPCGIKDLPTEVLDLVFSFLEGYRHNICMFLFTRATHEAAMNALWRRIDLGRTNGKPRIGALERCLLISPQHFERVLDFSFHVGHTKPFTRDPDCMADIGVDRPRGISITYINPSWTLCQISAS
jgi:hypothetical protein